MDATPRELRERIRAGAHDRPTAGLASGYVQANLVVLPARYADDFLLFCTRNPRPCPLLEVTDTGSPEPRATAPGADLRTDLPRYRAGLLGLRGDPAGGRGGEPARADAHPRTRPHVRHRPARRVHGRPVASGP